MRKLKTPSCGFTLIELLFIIVIIGIIAVMVVSSYQQRLTNFKVQKTALQMQQLVQAASAFYRDKRAWPQPGEVDFPDYIPVGLIKNPWDGTYSYQPANGNFQVFSGTLPTIQIADRLITLLPSTMADPKNPQQVVITVNVPGQVGPAQGNYIIQTIDRTGYLCDYDEGDCSQKTHTFTMTCPPGWTPQVLTVPKTIFADDIVTWGHSKAIYQLFASGPGYSQESGAYCTQQGSSNTYSCTIIARLRSNPYHSEKSLGTALFTYIGYCSQ